jgi:hypothetical protein
VILINIFILIIIMSNNYKNNKNSYCLTDRKQLAFGLEERLNTNTYGEIQSIGSLNIQSNGTGAITTTLRSVGLPISYTGGTRFFKPTSSGAFQISSSSANDSAAGTGARIVVINGLVLSADDKWIQASEQITLNGQTAVATTRTDWWRVNSINVISAGSGGVNAGALFVSPTGQALTSGVPNANCIAAVITGFNTSTMGDYSVPSNRVFHFITGNFYTNLVNVVVRESYTATTSNGERLTFRIGDYDMYSGSFDYKHASAYSEETDIRLDCFTSSGTATRLCYYIGFALVKKSAINAPINEFAT